MDAGYDMHNRLSRLSSYPTTKISLLFLFERRLGSIYLIRSPRILTILHT